MSDAIKKILLFGMTRASVEMGMQLRQRGYDFWIIDKDPALQAKADEYGLDLKIVDYTDDEVLEKEGIGQGVGLVYALFDEDVDNIFLTISIRAMDPTVRIIATTQSHDTIHKLKAAGANTVLDAYQITGRKIYELLKKPEVVGIIDDTVFGRSDINIEQLTITEKSSLNGTVLDALDAPDVIILGVHDKEMGNNFIFVTEGHRHILDAGDVIVLVGHTAQIQAFQEKYAL